MKDRDELFANQYDKELFNKIASKYSKKDFITSTRLVRKDQLYSCFKTYLQNQSVGTIVDLGCGIGAPAIFLNGLYKKYIGYDHSRKMVEIGKKVHLTNDRVSIIKKNITNTVELPENIADVVFCRGFIHHIPPDCYKKVGDTIRKLGKPKSVFIAIEPNNFNPFIKFLRLLRKHFDSSYSKEQRFFTKSELERILKGVGLREIEIDYKGYFAAPFGEVILNPQFIFVPLTKFLIVVDNLLERILPKVFKTLSWGLIVRTKLP